MEEDALETFYYDPRDNALSLLRDQDILLPEIISSSGDEDEDDWGKYNQTYQYKKAYSRHRQMFRSALKYSHEASAQVRATMQRARRAATNRV